MQRIEHDWAFAQAKKPFRSEHTVTLLDGDRDVFPAKKAQLWINHDAAQTRQLRHAPAAYE